MDVQDRAPPTGGTYPVVDVADDLFSMATCIRAVAPPIRMRTVWSPPAGAPGRRGRSVRDSRRFSPCRSRSSVRDFRGYPAGWRLIPEHPPLIWRGCSGIRTSSGGTATPWLVSRSVLTDGNSPTHDILRGINTDSRSRHPEVDQTLDSELDGT